MSQCHKFSCLMQLQCRKDIEYCFHIDFCTWLLHVQTSTCTCTQEVSLYSKSPHPMISTLLKKPQALYSSAIAALGNHVETLDLACNYYLTRHPLLMSVVQEVVNYFASRLTLVHVWKFGEHCNLLQIQHVQGVRLNQ